MVYKKLSSSALGDNALKLLPMPGRFIFDLFHEVKREKKLDSYSLNFVSQKFLGAGKGTSCFATAVVLDRLFTQVTRKST